MTHAYLKSNLIRRLEKNDFIYMQLYMSMNNTIFMIILIMLRATGLQYACILKCIIFNQTYLQNCAVPAAILSSYIQTYIHTLWSYYRNVQRKGVIPMRPA